MGEKTFVINVSINVDSIMLIKYCVEKRSLYIDTSLEQYDDFIAEKNLENITKYKQFEKNNLYHQNKRAFEAQKDSKITRLISMGMNPGCISQFVKMALIKYAEEKNISINTKKDGKIDYAKMGYDLGLYEIQVVEYDSQKFKIKSTKNKFVNSWSPIGLQLEASDLVMLSLNNKDKEALEKMGYKLIKGGGNIYFIPKRGMDIKRKSFTLDEKGNKFQYSGFLIPHAEIVSLSEFFEYKNESPTISYIYSPPIEAQKGLDFFSENNYKILHEFHTVRNKDVISGFDSIGALLHFKNGDKFGGWTVLGKQDVNKMNLMSGATTIQVASYMLPCILWAIKNTSKGINNSETIPFQEVMQFASEFLGKIYFKHI